MGTRCRGTFVISWSQTEIDGLKAAPGDMLTAGATWRWSGAALRVDGAAGPLLLEGAEGVQDTRRRAARMVRRLIGAALAPSGPASALPPQPEPEEAEEPDQGFVVTDGHDMWSLTLLPVPDTGAQLLMFLGDPPPVDRDLWIVRVAAERIDRAEAARHGGGIICFAPGTRIATPDGVRQIEDLRPGDKVLTRDNGPQPVLWTGHRRMTGARLYALPHLRPVRLRAGALGLERPEEDLVVSPHHRMLVQGPAARALFNTPEVLVRARDLLNDKTICIDHSLRDVTYVHLLLESHNIVWANGLETESFHPANCALETIDPAQRAGLLALCPGVEMDATRYGAYARRNLSAAEAAILRHDMARTRAA
jgi:hypothetical protein